MADLSNQAKLQKDINQLLIARQKLLEANSAQLAGQARLAKELHSAMSGKNLEGMEARVGRIQERMNSLSGAAAKAAENTRDIGEAAKKSEKDIEKFNKRAKDMATVLGAITGLRKGFALVTNVVRGATRVIGGFVKGIFRIGLAILSIPFKIFGGLVKMSQTLGSPALRQGLEDVRKIFGDLGSNTGLALKNSIKGARQEFNKLSGSGFRGARSFGRIFGYGREGLAKFLEGNRELAVALGGSFAKMTEKLKENYVELSIYRRGLGLTAEQQALIIKRSEEAGKGVLGRQEEIAKLASLVGKDFGFSAKEVGTTMGQMFEDVKVFGGFTDKQLTAMAVQSKRLGMELKDLQGVSAAFQDFDTTAENVAFLGRAFGIHLDAMKLFREEDPVAQIQQVQSAFKKSGLEFMKLSAASRAEIAKRTGIGDKAAASVLSQKGLEMDYNEVKKATAKAAKKQIDQGKVLLRLTKSIEKVVKSGSHQFTGFFDALSKGFTKGVRRTSEFRRLMLNLNMSLRQTDYAGRTMGRNFVKYFPGVKKFLDALADFFDPTKFVPALREMNSHFIRFFDTLGRTSDTSGAFRYLIEDLKGTLLKFFGKKGEIVDIIMTSTDTIITLFGNLKLAAMTKAAQSASVGLGIFNKILKSELESGGAGLHKAGDLAGTEFGKRFGKQTTKLINTIRVDLLPAIQESAPLIFQAALALMGKFREFMKKKEVYSKLIEGLAEAFKMIVKMKFAVMTEVIKGVATEPAMAAMLMTMMFGPAIVHALAARLAATYLTASRMAAASTAVRGGFANLMSMPLTAMATGAGGKLKAAGSAMFGMGKGLLGVAKGVLTKFGPIALGAGLLYGAKKAYDLKGTTGEKIEAGARGFGAAMIRFVSFGFADGEKVINSVFGQQIVGPIEKNLNIMEKSSSPAMRQMVKHARAISKEASAYTEYADAVDKAKSAAVSLEKYIRDEDMAAYTSFGKMEKRHRERVQSLTDTFGMTAEGESGSLAAVRSNLARVQRELHSKIVSSVDGPAMGYAGGAAMRAAARAPRRLTRVNNKRTNEAMQKLGQTAGGKDLIKAVRLIADDATNPHAPGAAILLQILTTGKTLEYYTKSAEAEAKGALGAIIKVQENLTKGARDEINRISGGQAGMDEVFREGQKKGGTGGRDAGKQYIRYLQDQVDMFIGQGKDKEFIDKARARVANASGRLQELNREMALELIAKISPDQMAKELDAAAGAGRYFTDPKKAKFSALDEDAQRDIKNQVQGRMINAFLSGDMTQLSSKTMGKAITAMMQNKGMQNVLDEASQTKLNDLEAAASTVARIKALEKIPAELEALKKTLGSTDAKQIKADAVAMVEAAMNISSAVNEAAKGKLDQQVATTVSESFLKQFDDIRRIQTGVSSIVGQRSTSDDTRKIRIRRFKDGVTELNAAFKEIAKLTFDVNTVDPVMQMMGLLPVITQGIIETVPDNFKNKITQAVKAVDAVNEMITKVQKVGGQKVESVVELVDVLNKGGELVVRSGTDVKVACIVKMNIDTKELANRIVLAPIDTPGQSGGDALATGLFPGGHPDNPGSQ